FKTPFTLGGFNPAKSFPDSLDRGHGSFVRRHKSVQAPGFGFAVAGFDAASLGAAPFDVGTCDAVPGGFNAVPLAGWVCLNSVTAAFNSPAIASLMTFSL